MSLIPINCEAIHDYSLNSDEGPDKTIFKIGVLDSFVRAYIDDSHSTFKKDTESLFDDVGIHDKYLQFVRFGLKGWSNFKDSEGKDVPFEITEIDVPRIGKRKVVSDESMKKLDLKWTIEIGLEVVSSNQLKELEAKKS